MHDDCLAIFYKSARGQEEVLKNCVKTKLTTCTMYIYMLGLGLSCLTSHHFQPWLLVLLVLESRVPRENHRPVANDKHYHIMLY